MSSRERGIFCIGLLSMAATVGLSIFPGMNFGDAWIRQTARVALLWYWAAILRMLCVPDNAIESNQSIDRTARWFWTWGAIVYLIHVVVAFHFFHKWSHTKAFDHVAHASRFGEGIYVSYFFTVLWTADVVWWWSAPQSYRQRAKWLSRAIYVFMLFIVVNATMVFETGVVRVLGACMLLSFALVVVTKWLRR
jgi:hypothetical protein